MTPMLRREANEAFRRTLTRTFLTPIVLLVLLAAIFFALIASLLDAISWVDHTQEVVGQTTRLETLIFDQETGLRGYLLTKNDSFLTPYATAQQETLPQIAALQQLVSDNSEQVERFALLQNEYNSWLEYANDVMTLRDQDGDYLALVESERGKDRTDAIRTLLDQIIATERGLWGGRAAQVRTLTATTLAGSAAALIVVGGALTVLIRRSLLRLSKTYNTALRSAEANEQELYTQREWFRGTLQSIGDAVIATDARGNISFINSVAEALTGWTHDEALGKPIEQIFRIQNQHTREPAEVPVERVLREGVIVGLANHTELIRRDGTSVPIDDSAAPVRDANGVMVGAVLVFRDISERYRAEEDLRDSEQRYRVLNESLPLAVYTADPTGRVTYRNSTWFSYTGVENKELDKLPPEQYVHPDDFPELIQHWQHSMQTGAPFEQEYRMRRADGTYHWQLGRALPVRDETGEIEQWIGTTIDIEARKQADLQLRENAEQFLQLAESMPQLVWYTAPNGDPEYFNQHWYNYTGTTPEQNTGLRWLDSVHPDDRAHTSEAWLGSMATGNLYSTQYRLREGATGTYRWMLARAAALRNSQGKIVRWFGTTTDIDDQRRFAERLQASERRYRDLAESMPMLVWTSRPEGYLDYVNPFWANYTGLPEADALGDWSNAIHDDDLPVLQREWQSSLVSGLPMRCESRLRRADGVYHWFLFQSVLRYENGQQPSKWYGTAIDIDEQRRAEQELRESEAEFRQITESMPQLVWTTLPDGYHIYFNQRWYDYTGTTLEEVRGDGWSRILHPDDYERTLEVWGESLRTGDAYNIEYRFREAATGNYRWFLGRAAAIRDADDQISQWFGTCTDIHEQKLAEQSLLERTDDLARTSEALENRNRELDQFAYVTSHDLKAPLRGIANLSQWIEEDLGEQATEDIRHQMDLLRGRVHRMEALIDGILQYSRVGRVKGAAETVDVKELLDDIIDLQAPPQGTSVEVVPPMPTIKTERLPLQQVFQNLISNAVKHGQRPDLAIRITAQSKGRFYQFAVADNGPGIAPQYHERIFVIFQTLASRDKVEGTGLGLSLVKKIVELRGGRVWLESAEGVGTTFYFTWPKSV